MRATLMASCLLLTACADIPELDNKVTPEGLAAPNPRIQPLDPLLLTASEAEISDETTTDLQARAAALQARADAIRATE